MESNENTMQIPPPKEKVAQYMKDQGIPNRVFEGMAGHWMVLRRTIPSYTG